MTRQDDMRALTRGLQELAMQYPRYELTPDTVRVYLRQLADIPVAAALAAMDRCGKTSTFFPAVSEIRGAVASHALGAADTAEEAWAEVIREAQRCGFNRPPTFMGGKWLPASKPRFSSETTRQAVESIGWRLINTTDDVQALRVDFIFTWRKFRERDLGAIQRGEFGAVTALPDGATTAPKELANHV
jgi:hypothetical protein